MDDITPETLLKIAQAMPCYSDAVIECLESDVRMVKVWGTGGIRIPEWFDPLNNAEQLKEIVKHWKVNVIECVDGDWIAWIKPTPTGSESKNESYELAILGAVDKAVESE